MRPYGTAISKNRRSIFASQVTHANTNKGNGTTARILDVRTGGGSLIVTSGCHQRYVYSYGHEFIDPEPHLETGHTPAGDLAKAPKGSKQNQDSTHRLDLVIRFEPWHYFNFLSYQGLGNEAKSR
ncbi:unnamed protein product [Penicillium discolor]